jgi:tRNA (cytidine/uridine-2'-O-)-methyltransferase
MDVSRERQATFGRNDRGPHGGLGLALWQPERPHNLGGALRLCACLDVALEIVEPAGFPLDDRRIRAAALDYAPHARCRRHADAASFLAASRAAGRRLVLLSGDAATPYHRTRFRPDDVLLLGSESRGVPPSVHGLVDLRVRIPMAPGRRSLNVVVAAAMALGEALRQTGGLDRLAGAVA